MVLHVTIFILYAPNIQNNSIYININPKIFIFLGLKSLDRLRGLPLFMSAHLRAGAVSRTEDASGAAGGCPQSVESAVLRAFEDASRTREGCFWHRISLPYRRSLFFTPNASENASRTPGSLFEHRVSIPYRRRGFLVRRASENASHLVVRGTGKRVAVASEKPVYPRTGQRQVAAAAEPGVHLVDLIQDTKSRPRRNSSRSI